MSVSREVRKVSAIGKNKYKYLGKNVLLFSISSFGSKILSFFFVSFYTSVLSTEEYGTADLVWTTATLLIFVVTLNIADAVVRFALEKTDEQNGIFSYGLRVILEGQLVFGMILLIFSLVNPIDWPWYLYFFLYITVFTSSLYQITTYYLRSFDEVKSVAIASIINTAFTIFSNLVLLLWFKTGVVGYLSSMVIGSSIATLFAFVVIVKKGKFSWNEVCDNETKHLMITYSIPLIFNGVSWWINNSLDRYLVTFFCGVSVNGVYAVASKVPTMLTTLQSVFSEAWNISAIKEFDENDKDGFFGNMYALYNGFSVLMASMLIMLNVLVAKILFSNTFFAAWQYSSLLVYSVVFSGLAGFVGGIFSVVKKTGFYAVSTIVASLINTMLNILLIPRMGAMGAAIATIISFVAVWLIRFIYAGKFIKWKINIVRDAFSYLLVAFQLVFDHANGHFYLGQIIIFLILLVLYKDILQKIVGIVIRKIRG